MARRRKFAVEEYDTNKGLSIWVVEDTKGTYDLYGAMRYASKKARAEKTCINLSLHKLPPEKLSSREALDYARDKRGY